MEWRGITITQIITDGGINDMQMEGVAVGEHCGNKRDYKDCECTGFFSPSIAHIGGKMRDMNLYNTCGEPDGLYGGFEGIPHFLLLPDIFGLGTSPKCSCKG